MWTTNYILSQIFAFIGISLLCASFLVKNKKYMLVLNITSAIGLSLQYLFLEAYVGMSSNLILCFATIWYFINEKLNRKKDYISIIAITIAYITFGILTYQNWIDIFIILAAVSFSYAIWQPNIKVYRIIGLFVSFFWLGYDIFYFTLVSMVFDVIILIVKIIGVVKLKYEKNSNPTNNRNKTT